MRGASLFSQIFFYLLVQLIFAFFPQLFSCAWEFFFIRNFFFVSFATTCNRTHSFTPPSLSFSHTHSHTRTHTHTHPLSRSRAHTLKHTNTHKAKRQLKLLFKSCWNLACQPDSCLLATLICYEIGSGFESHNDN